jgi:hypothetical protein
MDRLEGIDQVALESRRAALVAAAATEDQSLPAEDRRDRMINESLTTEQRALVFGSILKHDDDVICGGLPLRVVGPAEGKNSFYGQYDPWFADLLINIEAFYVTERAPADALETPMPIYPEPPGLLARQVGTAFKPVTPAERRKVLLRVLEKQRPENRERLRRVLVEKGLLLPTDKLGSSSAPPAKRRTWWQRLIAWLFGRK